MAEISTRVNDHILRLSSDYCCVCFVCVLGYFMGHINSIASSMLIMQMSQIVLYSVTATLHCTHVGHSIKL